MRITEEIQQAEQRVKESTEHFEIAMEHLEEKVEDTSRKIQHMKELAGRPKKVAKEFINTTQTNLNELRVRSANLLSNAKQATEKAAIRVKENPTPFIIGLAAVAGTIGLAFYFQRNRFGFRSQGADHDVTVDVLKT